MNIQIDISVHRSDLETTILASFPSKSLNYTVNHFVLTEIFIPNLREIHHLYKNVYNVSNKCEIIESN